MTELPNPRLDLDGLLTESRREELADIDLVPTEELARLMNEDDSLVPAAVARAIPAIAAAIDAVVLRLAAGGRLVYVGAGSAGRLGVLDASEAAPTFGTAPGQVVGILAGGAVALSEAVEEVED